MTRFLLRLAVFLAASTTAFVVLFVAAVQLNRQAVNHCRVGEGIDSVILGDSHTAWAIDDTAVPGLSNLSVNAEGYKYTYLKLERLLRTKQQVKRVYLAFSYANLAGYYDDYITGATFRLFADRYLGLLSASDLLELVRNSPSTAPDLFQRLLRGGLPAGIRQECTLYQNFFTNPATRRFETFRPDVMEKRIAEQYYLNGALQGQSAVNLEYLDRIIRLLRAHGIEIVMLNTPMHAEYQKRVPARFREMYSQVLEQYGLPSFDFSDLKLGDAEFLPDGDHTNYPGAMLVTRRFAEYHAEHPVSQRGQP